MRVIFAVRETSSTGAMESIKGHPEYVETVFGEAIVARDESLVVLAGASGLGPPDLCWLQKAPKSALTGATGEAKGYYHYVLGGNASSSAAVAAYFATLTAMVEPPTFLQVRIAGVGRGPGVMPASECRAFPVSMCVRVARRRALTPRPRCSTALRHSTAGRVTTYPKPTAHGAIVAPSSETARLSQAAKPLALQHALGSPPHGRLSPPPPPPPTHTSLPPSPSSTSPPLPPGPVLHQRDAHRARLLLLLRPSVSAGRALRAVHPGRRGVRRAGLRGQRARRHAGPVAKLRGEAEGKGFWGW